MNSAFSGISLPSQTAYPRVQAKMACKIEFFHDRISEFACRQGNQTLIHSFLIHHANVRHPRPGQINTVPILAICCTRPPAGRTSVLTVIIGSSLARARPRAGTARAPGDCQEGQRAGTLARAGWHVWQRRQPRGTAVRAATPCIPWLAISSGKMVLHRQALRSAYCAVVDRMPMQARRPSR